MSASPPIAALSPHDVRRDRLALEAAGLGVWELDIASGKTEWNAQMYALHGIAPGRPPLTFDEWLARVHPQDRGAVEMAFSQLLEDPAPLTLVFRILRENGEIRHLRSVTRSFQHDDASTRWLVGINEDVTDRVRDRQLAEAKSRELQTFFDVSLSLMCITTLQGDFQTVNQAWERVLGHAESTLVGRSFLDLVHPDDLASTRQAMHALHDGQEVAGFINRYRHRDGSYRHIEWRSTPRDGRIYATAHDVSARIDLERQLAEERNYLQLIIDSLPSPVFAKDWQGRHILANRSVATLFGTTPEAMIGRTDAEMPLPPDIHEKFLRDDREVMIQGRPKTILEQPMPDGHGDIRWFQVVKVPLMADRPVAERQVLGIATDVTEREHNEQRLKRQEALYRSLVESQQDLIVRVDTHNRFTFVNDAYCTTFGKSREALIGKTFTPLVHEDDLPHTLSAIDRLKQPPYSRVTIVQRAMTQAGWRWLSWEDSAILDEAGSLLEIQAVGRDITDLKEAQQHALSSNRAKSQFLANMSHEIRTPLNAIIGFGELLSQSPLSAEQQDWIDKVKASSQLLLSIVNDILDFSKIEAGKLELESRPFHPKELIAQQEALFGLAANEKALRFRTRQGGDATAALLGDPLRLGQVLTNLVGNAIKFTERGEVELVIHVEAIDRSRCRLTCSVNDTGIGISAAQQKRLFNAFTQADTSTSRRYGGTGLGLVISQRLVEQMGGKLSLSSQPGQGSRFTFSLPLEISEAPLRHPPGAKGYDLPRLGGKKVLLAEDNPINQALTRRLLEDLGVEVSVVDNGREAVDSLRQHGVDLVLMDLQMPVMDGLEAARRIRQDNATLPIIALSAAVLSEERQQALGAGMNEHLAKPVQPRQLTATLLHWLTDDDASPPAAADESYPISRNNEAWLERLEAEGFDTQAGLEAAAGDRELFRRVLELFGGRLHQQETRSWREAAQSPDTLEALKRELHMLKGSAASVGARDLANHLARVEEFLTHYHHVRQTDIDQLIQVLEWTAMILGRALST
ncbi:PAS domain S-box protein [Halomonas sp. 3H]|uniref:PAS domain S-box protein n=1 Tax=Halomonas sp. 3H TaxID=2952527 RepID=UPI0020B727E9|nr:PAS domain S-box protein [Halomonas sp. 3H]